MPPTLRRRARALGAPALGLGLLLAAAVPASAQLGAPGQNEQPIEITSDSLVVRQQEKTAIFSGNVEAVQGDMTLRADELKVLYADDRQRAAGPAGGDQAIRRLEAQGHVFMSSADQTVQGDRGVYDPTTGKINLDGNVILTRAGNVIRGGQLEFDVRTGVATVRAGRGGPAGGEQRVKALFKPEPRTEPRKGQ